MLLSPLSADLTQLHTLWKDVFGDEDGYIDLFFSGAYFSSHPFAVVENGEVRSVLYLLVIQRLLSLCRGNQTAVPPPRADARAD